MKRLLTMLGLVLSLAAFGVGCEAEREGELGEPIERGGDVLEEGAEDTGEAIDEGVEEGGEIFEEDVEE